MAIYPSLCAPPRSHYIDSPPGTKYLLHLRMKDNTYESVLGPCGALRVTDSDQVFWYTDDSKAQRYSKPKMLNEVIERIKRKVK